MASFLLARLFPPGGGGRGPGPLLGNLLCPPGLDTELGCSSPPRGPLRQTPHQGKGPGLHRASGPRPASPAAGDAVGGRQVCSPWKATALSLAGRSCAAAQPACSSRGSRAWASLMAAACVSPSSEGRGQDGLTMCRERDVVCSAGATAGRGGPGAGRGRGEPGRRGRQSGVPRPGHSSAKSSFPSVGGDSGAREQGTGVRKNCSPRHGPEHPWVFPVQGVHAN